MLPLLQHHIYLSNFHVVTCILYSFLCRLSERSPFDGSCCGGYTGGDESNSSDSEPTPPTRYRVVMLGDSGTGKTGK